MNEGGDPRVRVKISGGQGIQTGGGNTQINYFSQKYFSQRETARPGTLVVGDVPQESPTFQARSDVLEKLNAAGPGVAVVRSVTGMRGLAKLRRRRRTRAGA
jgi:hypothetical protein